MLSAYLSITQLSWEDLQSAMYMENKSAEKQFLLGAPVFVKITSDLILSQSLTYWRWFMRYSRTQRTMAAYVFLWDTCSKLHISRIFVNYKALWDRNMLLHIPFDQLLLSKLNSANVMTALLVGMLKKQTTLWKCFVHLTSLKLGTLMTLWSQQKGKRQQLLV